MLDDSNNTISTIVQCLSPAFADNLTFLLEQKKKKKTKKKQNKSNN
jgi:hypothetical protein